MSEAFNFEDFISGAQLPRRTVSVYMADLSDEIRRLQVEHDQALDDADERVSSKGASAEIAERIKALVEQMEASKRTFVLRTLTPAEFAKLQDDDDLGVTDQLALQSVEPALTAEQWERVGEVIGAGQWATLVRDANDLVLSRVAVPDFSQSVLASLALKGSSRS